MKTSKLMVLALLTLFAASGAAYAADTAVNTEAQQKIDALKQQAKSKHAENKATMKQHHEKIKALHEDFKKQADDLRKQHAAAVSAGNIDKANDVQKQLDALKEVRHDKLQGPRAEMRAHKDRMRADRKAFHQQIKDARKDAKK